jgi:hypothetical protein
MTSIQFRNVFPVKQKTTTVKPIVFRNKFPVSTDQDTTTAATISCFPLVTSAVTTYDTITKPVFVACKKRLDVAHVGCDNDDGQTVRITGSKSSSVSDDCLDAPVAASRHLIRRWQTSLSSV